MQGNAILMSSKRWMPIYCVCILFKPRKRRKMPEMKKNNKDNLLYNCLPDIERIYMSEKKSWRQGTHTES